jgi:hypothetical protein
MKSSRKRNPLQQPATESQLSGRRETEHRLPQARCYDSHSPSACQLRQRAGSKGNFANCVHMQQSDSHVASVTPEFLERRIRIRNPL